MIIAAIISVFSLAFCVFVFFYTKWYIKRHTSSEALLAEYRKEVYELNAQIDATTDRDIQLIEARIASLKALLEDTDKRIAVYVRELDRSRSGEALYTSLGRGIRAALNPAAETPQPPDAKSPDTNPLPVTLKLAAARPAAASENSVPQVKVRKEPVPKAGQGQAVKKVLPKVKILPEAAVKSVTTTEQIHFQIAGLAAQGFSPGEIASKLDLSLSEVDLALNLLDRDG